MVRFNKHIKEIQDNNEFFDIDYNDVLNNFDTDDIDKKVKVNMQLSLVNVAFLDAIRGMITRPKMMDRILTIYRHEWIEDLKNRMSEESDSS